MNHRVTLLLLSLPFALFSQTARPVIHTRVAQSTGAAVYGCKLYDENSNCLGCIRDQYLSAGACVDVPDSSLIVGCNIYASVKTCMECDNGLVPSPDGATCTTGNTVLGCAVFNDSASCKTCPPGSYASGASCIAIQNCVSVANQTCAICAANYYPAKSGAAVTCTQIASSARVANCQYYGSDQLCAACANGFALATNGSACLSAAQVKNQVDANCAETNVNGDGVCMICREGHYLKNGVCQACTTSETCFVCDPDNPSQCLVCLPGYYQSSVGGACTRNVVDSLGQRDPLNNDSALFGLLPAALLLFLALLG